MDYYDCLRQMFNKLHYYLARQALYRVSSDHWIRMHGLFADVNCVRAVPARVLISDKQYDQLQSRGNYL